MLAWLLICMTCPIISADKNLNALKRAEIVTQFKEKFADSEKLVKYSFSSSGSSGGVIFGETGEYAYGMGKHKNCYKMYRFTYSPVHVKSTCKMPLEPEVKLGTAWNWYVDENRTLGCCEVKYVNNITFIGYSPAKMIVVRYIRPPFCQCIVDTNSIICKRSDKGTEWVVFLTINDSGAYDANGKLIENVQWQPLDFKHKKHKE